jgi:hypothetical protein
MFISSCKSSLCVLKGSRFSGYFCGQIMCKNVNRPKVGGARRRVDSFSSGIMALRFSGSIVKCFCYFTLILGDFPVRDTSVGTLRMPEHTVYSAEMLLFYIIINYILGRPGGGEGFSLKSRKTNTPL